MFSRLAHRYLPLALILALVLAASFGRTGDVAAAAGNGNGRTIAVTGVGSVGGEPAIVHIIAVVGPGKSADKVAAAALEAQGARALTKAEFSTLSNSWDQFFDGTATPSVDQRYNGSNSPEGLVQVQDEMEAARATWNADDNNSVFAFGGRMPTDGLACPSLIKECKGKQYFDSYNDVSWVELRGSTTLAVAWSGTSTDESDVAFNTKFNWTIDGAGTPYDIQTVALHEFGHVAGLGHSTESDSVMLPNYGGVDRDLGDDDIAGLQFIYDGGDPYDDGGGTDSSSGDPTVIYVGSDGGFTNGDGVGYDTSGKKGRDLIITATITDGTTGVEGVSVSISVDDADGLYGTGSGTTDSNGQVKWKIRNGASGTWSTTVVSATIGSVNCTGCPDGKHSYPDS